MTNLHYIKDEMLVHVPLCTHAKPENVLIIGGCDKIKAEAEKHYGLSEIITLSENIDEEMANFKEDHFDVIIIADNFRVDRVFWGLLNKTLSTNGVITTVASNMLTEQIGFKAELKILGELFKVVMPYRYEGVNGDIVTSNNLLLASHTYHPTADINLQRADLTDGFNYYNSDIAIGAFHLPTVVRKEFLGLVKL